MPKYTLDNAWTEARERLTLMEQELDPGTIRHLEVLGVRAGWHCLEVGGGGGSITAWLCQRVGPTGHVVATDLDTRFLAVLEQPNLTVRRHDIVTDPLPEAAFDLVHVRCVLEHLASDATALSQSLTHLTAALKPGGWLLVEDTDYASFVPDPGIGELKTDLFCRARDAVVRAVTQHGVDVYYGRRLAGDLQRYGVTVRGGEARSSLCVGGTPYARYCKLSFTQGKAVVDFTSDLSEDDYDRMLALWDDPQFRVMSHMIVAVWGNRAPM